MDYVALAIKLGIKGYIAGKELRAKCPLHPDRNPSFSINLENGLWTCFAGCGGGDFVRLIERVLDCSPQEAHSWLVHGKATSIEHMSKALSEQLDQNLIPFPTNVVDTQWRDIYLSTNSKFMPIWFINRGFTWKTIIKWNIHYDPVKDSIIIPVFSDENELIGTVTRNHNGTPKYQNSPGLPKTKFLFGEISGRERGIIICEGILDALWLWQLGYNVAALLGTHLSQEHIGILKAYKFGEIVLALDNDEAGWAGTQEAYAKLTKAGWLLPQIKFIQFPEGKKDPQDCTGEEFAGLFAERKDFIYGN